jgi:hypothetical protein
MTMEARDSLPPLEIKQKGKQKLSVKEDTRRVEALAEGMPPLIILNPPESSQLASSGLEVPTHTLSYSEASAVPQNTSEQHSDIGAPPPLESKPKRTRKRVDLMAPSEAPKKDATKTISLEPLRADGGASPTTPLTSPPSEALTPLFVAPEPTVVYRDREIVKTVTKEVKVEVMPKYVYPILVRQALTEVISFGGFIHPSHVGLRGRDEVWAQLRSLLRDDARKRLRLDPDFSHVSPDYLRTRIAGVRIGSEIFFSMQAYFIAHNNSTNPVEDELVLEYVVLRVNPMDMCVFSDLENYFLKELL